MAKPKDEDETHLIDDPIERAQFQNATLAKVRINSAEILGLQAEIKKRKDENSASFRDIKSCCGLDRDVVEEGMAKIDLPEVERAMKFFQLRQFYQDAGFGEQTSFLPMIAPAKAPDRALDASLVQVAAAAGFNAGMQGKPAGDNPYPGASAEGVAWAAAFSRGQAQIVRGMAPASDPPDAWAEQQLGGGTEGTAH